LALTLLNGTEDSDPRVPPPISLHRVSFPLGVLFHHENGGSRFLGNIDTDMPAYTVPNPKITILIIVVSLPPGKYSLAVKVNNNKLRPVDFFRL
jgi:hypothetical protein